MNTKVKEAVNMVGHLLEHHPTTGEAARDINGRAVASTSPEASCWCVVGACSIVQNALKLEHWDRVSLSIEMQQLVGGLIETWEGPGTSKRTRLALARKLQKA
jgi:hypothetical protein